jgi:pimeloyl-ACP methyl ester carboxylesterase
MLFPALAVGKPVHIPGPEGPLEGEMIVVDGALHAVVIVPGSGPTDRDGNSSQGLATNTYRLLAEGLAEAGISSVRIDKRGLYGSSMAIANPNNVTLSAYAEDVRNWVGFVSDLAPCVWIAGHSEGGLVALVAAQNAPANLCGLILLATPGRPAGELLIEQLEGNPHNAPLVEDIRSIVTDLEGGRRREAGSIPPILQPLFVDSVQGYLIDLFSYDPSDVAATWRGPALIVQGDADRQVRLKDADLLVRAMPQARRLHLAGGTHMLKALSERDPLADYRDPSLPLHAGLLGGIVQFLEASPSRARLR